MSRQRLRHRSWTACAIVFGGVTLTIAACSDDLLRVGDRDPDSGSKGDTGALFDSAFGDVAHEDCPTSCSTDLHELRNCRGEIIKTCPDDMACNPTTGACGNACEAATAARGSVGCEFYAISPTEGCFAAFVANVSRKPITLGVEFGGTPANLDDVARIPSGSGTSLTYQPLPGGLLPPGQVAILFLADIPGEGHCPSGVRPPGTNPKGPNSAFHITSDYPVAAYDIGPYGGGDSARTSATLLFPTGSWGDNYLVMDPWKYERLPHASHTFSFHVVAREDDTDVTVAPTQNVEATENSPAMRKGEPTTVTLRKGEKLTLWSGVDGFLAGSVLKATKPVGAWSLGVLNIEESECCADYAHQELPPVKTLGSEYVAARYRNRYDDVEESPPWRILGLVDGTTLTYEPSAPPGAPTTLRSGEVATFRTPNAFVVRSQDDDHPIYVSGHMTGCEEMDPGQGDCRGDPEFVNVVPAKQYLSSYVFFSDMTYPDTNVVVVRAKGRDGFKDVVLDCAGPLGDWQPIGESYEFTRVDLVRGNFEPQSYAGGTCDNGRHEIKSEAPFGITVWGWGSAASWTQAVSYAYPGGQGVSAINHVVVPAIPK